MDNALPRSCGTSTYQRAHSGKVSIANMKFPFPLKSFNFFRDLTKSVVDQRKKDSKTGMKRNDLVQLLMDSFVYETDLDNTNYDKLTATADKIASSKGNPHTFAECAAT